MDHDDTPPLDFDPDYNVLDDDYDGEPDIEEILRCLSASY